MWQGKASKHKLICFIRWWTLTGEQMWRTFLNWSKLELHSLEEGLKHENVILCSVGSMAAS